MNIWKTLAISLLIYNSLIASAYAETTFITDKIVVDIFADKFQRGIAIKSLPSGTVVEVVQTDGDFAKVRTIDNKEGWLHSKFLTTEKPAQLGYAQLMAEHKTLEQELTAANEKLKGSQNAEKELIAVANVRKELKQAKTKIAKLDKTVKNKTQALSKAEKELTALQQSVTELQEQLKQKDQGGETSVKVEEQNKAKPIKVLPIKSPPTKTTPAPQDETRAAVWDMPIPLKWVLTALLLSTLLGVYLGYQWLDAKIRKRHGGVRIR